MVLTLVKDLIDALVSHLGLLVCCDRIMHTCKDSADDIKCFLVALSVEGEG